MTEFDKQDLSWMKPGARARYLEAVAKGGLTAAAAADPAPAPADPSILASTDPAVDPTPAPAPVATPAPAAAVPAEALELELKIELPEGVEVPQEQLDPFIEYAKEHKLNSEQASAMVKYQLDSQNKATEALRTSWTERGATWLKELRDYPDVGGTDDKFKENLLLTKKALRQYGGEALARELSELGLGNHKGLVKAFNRIGRAMAEDVSQVDGSTHRGEKDAATAERDRLAKLYPSMFPQKQEGGNATH